MELCTKPIDLLRASMYRRRSRYRYQLEDMAPALQGMATARTASGPNTPASIRRNATAMTARPIRR